LIELGPYFEEPNSPKPLKKKRRLLIYHALATFSQFFGMQFLVVSWAM